MDKYALISLGFNLGIKLLYHMVTLGFSGGTSGKELSCQCRRCKKTWVRSLGWEDPPEEGMTTHSSTLAWRIPWTEEPVRLQSMGLQRVGHGCLGHGVWAVNSTRETLKALVLSVTLRGPGVEG